MIAPAGQAVIDLQPNAPSTAFTPPSWAYGVLLIGVAWGVGSALSLYNDARVRKGYR